MTKHSKEIVGGLTAAVAAVAGAQVASAADAAMPDISTDWSGPYIGVSLGVEGGQTPVGLDGNYQLAAGPNFGAFIGVNHEMSNALVIGAELAIQSGVGGDSTHLASEAYNVNFIADSKVKLGMAVSPQTLIYGFGGISAGTLTQYGPHTYDFVAANFGVGAEYKVSQQFSLGVEVLARAPISAYHWDDIANPGLDYQGSLRAAFHF